MTHDDIAFSEALDLGEMLAARKISSVELTKLYLDRLEQYGSTYGAVVTIMRERGLREAAQADSELAAGKRRSPIHGVPYGVKDLLAAVGAPTTWGAAPYKNQHFNFDGTVVQRLHAAGAVLIAKLAMVELAGGFGYNTADASFTGPGRTPWNRDFWSGGSSSGPGAATAAGLVGFSIGSETDGSIMVPSSFCGVSGLRPTYGRVSRHGAMALMWTSDKLGPIARSARDAIAILRIIAGKDANDPTSQTKPFSTLNGKARIGVLKGARAKSQREVVANFDASLDVLRGVADLVENVSLPDFPYGAAFGALINGECSAAFRDLIESGRSGELQSVDDKTGGYVTYGTLAVDFVDAMRVRSKVNDAMYKLMSEYDALVFPTTATVANPIAVPFSESYNDTPGEIDPTTPANMAGIPAISVPNGFGQNGLPTAIAFIGKAWGEAQIAQLAQSLQRRTDFHKRHPKLVTVAK